MPLALRLAPVSADSHQSPHIFVRHSSASHSTRKGPHRSASATHYAAHLIPGSSPTNAGVNVYKYGDQKWLSCHAGYQEVNPRNLLHTSMKSMNAWDLHPLIRNKDILLYRTSCAQLAVLTIGIT